MTVLLLALVLGASVEAQRDLGRSPGVGACSVRVLAVGAQGGLVSTRTFWGSRTPAVVFRGWASQVPEGDPPLLFDVFNPRGQRYQVLLGGTPGRSFVLQGDRPRPGRPVEASLAVAGSSIALTSMYGRWRVVPRFEGDESPCGPAQSFTIRP